MKLKTSHVLELDGLKGLAILLVMAFSCYLIPMSFDLLLPADPGGADYWLQMLIGSGWVGIDLLMVVAGFLSTNELFAEPGVRPFYLRRWRRIAPAYFFLLLAWFGLAKIYQPELTRGGDWLGLLSLWTFTSNILAALDGLSRLPVPLQHLWAVAVSAQFYLIWPLVVRMLGTEKRVLKVCIGVVIAMPITRALLLADDDSLGVAAVVLMPLRLDSFAWGAIVSLAGERLVEKNLSAVISLLSAALLTFYFFWAPGLSLWDPTVIAGGFSLLGMFFASLLPMILPRFENEPRSNFLTDVLNFPLLHLLGRYSLGLYLFHQPVIVFFLYWAYLPGPGWSPFIVFSALSMGISLLVAMISFQVWERRFT